ncbi:LysR family transcriptional regulator [Croceitalea vernalis]|uniref:LysR family transcriptional regulator n=1 Tax=Croceitalea vernalis TaxID=3075599 RepID=A0ABU3BCF2_9FLAO|nr:LysR family transcriptional regulator [Croceitalea sp. P007]MDT0620153.1 LysR family transcriptional regulator [Croceitalea sp. P007]
MNYTLNQLRIFVKVAQNQSITKASEELHLTQPAVSIQLKNFQDQFPIPLTEVVGRRLFLTEFGKEIAIAAENVLNEISAINYKTLEYGGKLAGRLKMAVVSTGKYVMPYFLSGFMSKHSGVDLIMDVTNKSSVVQNLENNEVDFALVSVLPKHLKVDRVELMENILYLVGNDNILKPTKTMNLKSLAEAPLIFRENGSATRMAMENYLSSKHIKVSKKIELTSNEAVKQAVVAGLGYSIMPLIGIKNELKNNSVNIYNLPNLPIRTNWNLIWLPSKKFSPVAKTFLSYIIEQKENIINTQFSWFNSYK